MRRVVINGVSGSGKSTLARELSRRWSLPAIESDALFWEPGWQEASPQAFRQRVEAATSGPRWIFDGNYSSVRDVVWARAELIIWLDFPLGLCLLRVLGRSLRRAGTREELWNGNRESWRRVLSRDAVALHTLRTHALKRRQMPDLLQHFQSQGRGQVLVARSPRDLGRLLCSVARRVEPAA